MPRQFFRHFLAFLPLFALALGPSILRADDAATGFSLSANPIAPWSYGWTPTLGGAYSLFAAKGTDAQGIDFWRNATSLARVSHNGTGTGKLVGSVYTPANGLSLQPGNGGQYCVVRWTAVTSGSYTLHARFKSRVLSNGFMTAEIAVLLDGAVLLDQYITSDGATTSGALDATLTLTAGQNVDFVVGDQHDGSAPDVVGLDATVDREHASVGLDGPVFAFGGERFVGCRFPSAADEIAFDPINRRVASFGKLRDFCGNALSDGPAGGLGLCWDQKTSTYWQVTADRRVRRWSAAGALLDTVFTIPLTFAVPGESTDTLSSVRGIATDSNFVYLVDAGPSPGAISSNEWLKFTRTGSPVKTSRVTDFVAQLAANLDPTFDFDALVDDIVYVPYGAAPYAGKLMIALEHSGMQVIDTDGYFVDAIRWSRMPFHTRPLAAFAGLTVDAATGNFYLADNDAGAALVLTKLPGPQATSYAIGTAGGFGGAVGMQLKNPIPGCGLPLWKTYGLPPTASGNMFGLTYRSADHFAYTMDYGGGDLWRADPLLGAAQRVGPTGLNSVWGVAYDSERDVFCLLDGSSATHVLILDPVTLAVHPLPQVIGYSMGGNTDLAWSSADKKLYACDASVNPPRLIRIDRDSGVGTVVGNLTSFVGGMEYDPASGFLLGLTGSSLYRIDPQTAAMTLVSSVVGNGFEGLAVIPVPVSASVLAVEGGGTPVAPRLRAFPNPARAGTTLAFSLPAAIDAQVGIYDVAGRLVRELARGPFTAGLHRVAWDGRDRAGVAVASGAYFARVESPGQTTVTRVSVVR